MILKAKVAMTAVMSKKIESGVHVLSHAYTILNGMNHMLRWNGAAISTTTIVMVLVIRHHIMMKDYMDMVRTRSSTSITCGTWDTI